MKKEIDALLSLLRCALFDVMPDEDVKIIAEEKADVICDMAKYHDVAHLLAYAYKKSDIKVSNAETLYDFKWQQAMAIMRYENLSNEFRNISELLESEKIDFIPLKGIIIRELYPEPWMRTSCDMDILVRKDDFEKAEKLIVEKLGYTSSGERNYHDVSLFSASGEHLELHFNVKENMDNIDGLLEKIWEFAYPKNDGSHEYVLTKEFLMFQIAAHMSYHFAGGGCGIRSFADLLIMNNKLSFNKDELESMLEECKIKTFYEAALRLSKVWFASQKHDDVTLSMQTYLLRGGVYGSKINAITTRRADKGKLSYVLERIFMPYEQLLVRYPKLEGKKYLVPLYQVKRWCDIILKGRVRYSVKELSDINSLSQKDIDSVANLFENLCLKNDK